MGSAAQPGTVLLGFVDEFTQKVAANTKNEIKVERLFIGSEQEATQQVVRGRIEIGSISYTGTSGLVPEAAVLNMPYVWNSTAEKDFVTDKFALPVLRKIYESKGLVLLGLGEVGWNDVVCKKACLTPDSVKGMKVRIAPSPASKMFWTSLNANGVQMPLTELFPGLQSGLVNGADLPFLFYVTTPAAQSAPHYVMTRHYHHPSTFIVNKGLFDGMKPELRAKLLKALPDANWARKQVADTEGPKMKEFVAKGGFVHQLTDAQREAWAAVIRPGQAEMVQAIGGKAQEVMDALNNGKKAWAEKFGKK